MIVITLVEIKIEIPTSLRRYSETTKVLGEFRSEDKQSWVNVQDSSWILDAGDIEVAWESGSLREGLVVQGYCMEEREDSLRESLHTAIYRRMRELKNNLDRLFAKIDDEYEACS